MAIRQVKVCECNRAVCIEVITLCWVIINNFGDCTFMGRRSRCQYGRIIRACNCNRDCLNIRFRKLIIARNNKASAIIGGDVVSHSKRLTRTEEINIGISQGKCPINFRRVSGVDSYCKSSFKSCFQCRRHGHSNSCPTSVLPDSRRSCVDIKRMRVGIISIR